MEVVFVDDGTPVKPFWPKDKVKGLAYRRFADVISTDEKGVPREMDDAMGYTSEVRDRQASYFHVAKPSTGGFYLNAAAT